MRIFALRFLKWIFFGVMLAIGVNGFGQACSDAPVEDAVINGDFEKGYVNGAGTRYMSDNSPVDFSHNFNWPYAYTGNGTACIYGAAGLAGVARNQRHTCGWGPYIGYGYVGTFRDHTPGKNGNGFALIADYNGGGGATKIVWQQTVNVYPSQEYHFAAWFARYGSLGWTGRLRFYARGNVSGTRELIATATINAGVMVWRQFSGTWDSQTNTSAILQIEFVANGGTNTDDIAIDDISFVNGCDAITSAAVPSFTAAEYNLCASSGSIDLVGSYTDPGSTSNNTVQWFEGSGSIQTDITAQATGMSLTGITTPGTYRLCVYDTDNGCATNATAVITEEMTLNIPNVELCNPAFEDVDIDDYLTPTGNYNRDYVWTGVNPNPGDVNEVTFGPGMGGNYTVDVSNPNRPLCTVSDGFNVTDNLPKAPRNIQWCQGTNLRLLADTANGSSNRNWRWCSDASCNTVVASESGGNSVVYSGSNAFPIGSRTLYLQDATSTAVGGNPLQRTRPTQDGRNSSNMVITVTQSVKLRTVRLSHPGYISGNVVIRIRENSGTGPIIYNRAFAVASGANRTLNVTLTPGIYVLQHLNRRAHSFAFGQNPTVTSLNGYVTLNAGNTSFYNLVFEASNACEPIPVDIEAVSCCTAPGATVAIQGVTNDTIKVCDDTTLDADITGGNAGMVTQWYQIGTGTLGGEGTANPGDTETSGTISASGWYSIHVADNSAGLTSCADGDTVYVLITATPSAPSVTAVSICTGQQLNIGVNSPDADYTYNWTGPNTYSATVSSATVVANATLTPTDYSGNYAVTATENGCTSTATNLGVTLTQSPTIASVNVDTSFCAYNFDLADLHGAASNGTITYHSDAPAYSNLGGSTVSSDDTYHLVVTDGSCADTVAVTTTATGDPLASWTGSTGVCSGNSADLTVTITGGSANYTVHYTDGTTPASATHTATGQTISLGAGTYTLDSVVDNNGCSHLNIADIETIATQADVDATVSVLCTGETGADGMFAADEFQIMVNINAGDTSNVVVEEFGTAVGVSFGGATSPGIWHSGAIDETQSVNIRIHDNRCDTILEVDLQRVCSCPGVATLTGAATICNNETTDLTITLQGVGPFDFELHQNGVVYNGGNGSTYAGAQTGITLASSSITVTISDSGTYTIENLLDYEGGATACAGSELGTQLVAFYTHPDGDIILDASTGANPICLDDDTDVDIEVTQGAVGPFTAYYTQNNTQTTGATTGTGIGTINITADTGRVVLDSIVDVNGCASTINEDITITAHDTLDVTATIVCSDDASTPGLPNDGFYIEVTTATATIDDVVETSGNGLMFNNLAGTWTSGVTNETNSVDISVTDDNGCHTVTITGLQQTCSCPTEAVLGYATNGEACAGGAGVVLEIDTLAGNPATWTNATVSVTGPGGSVLTNQVINTIPHQFSVPDSGEYTLTIFTDNGEGCNAQLNDDTATAVIYSLPTGTLTGGSESCIGSPSDPITLTLTGAGSSWNVDYTQTTTVGTINDDDNIITTSGTSTLISSTSSATDSGTYVITSIEMTAGNVTCTATDLGNISPSISFSPAQGASIDSDVHICADSSGVLTANNEGGGVTYTWSLGGQDVGTGLMYNVTNAPGVYTLTTKKNGCADQSDQATVTVVAITVTAVANSAVISEGDNVTLSSVTNGTSCEWFDPSLTSIGTSCTESYEAPAPGGVYTLVSTDGQCVGTGQVSITVVEPIQIPDAFTPNGDDVNDVFTIRGISTYTNASITVYNRWGNVVYRMLGGDNYAAAPWDGKLNGNDLPAGVYYYSIDLGLTVEEAMLVPDTVPKSGSIIITY